MAIHSEKAAGHVHTVILEFADGARQSVSCGEHEDIIASSLNHGLLLLSECRQGACGACRAHVDSGDYELSASVSSYVLTEADIESGQVLLCQTYARSDLELRLDYDSQLASPF